MQFFFSSGESDSCLNGKVTGTRVQNGDMVRVKGKLDLVPEASNRGEFDPRQVQE